MAENEEAPAPSGPDCGTTALISGLKAIFFLILPLTTLFSVLALPIFGCLPQDNLAALGVLLLIIYQLTFLVIFVIIIITTVVLDSDRFWAPSLDQYFHKTRRHRGHPALMLSQRYKNYLRTHRYSVLVHGTDEAHPVHLRECQKMKWSDTVGDHGLGTLSSITLSASLLGGVSVSATAGLSRPKRDKAEAFFAALNEGAAETEPTKRKRKRAPGPHAVQGNDMEVYSSGVDKGEDEDSSSDDSDLEMVVDGEVPFYPVDLADTFTAKTDPKAGKTHSRDKGKDKATTKPSHAPKASKKAKPRKNNPIWHFYEEVMPEDVTDAEPDKKYYSCNLGCRAIIPLTKSLNRNIVREENEPMAGTIEQLSSLQRPF
ncbi:hypothetical protein C8J57DRAFT_1233095 [Mycena rebaudengoi]|nr:hypothetical protein C8J57DRAFT_1233095 [Mycena rebaudengoi]